MKKFLSLLVFLVFIGCTQPKKLIIKNGHNIHNFNLDEDIVDANPINNIIQTPFNTGTIFWVSDNSKWACLIHNIHYTERYTKIMCYNTHGRIETTIDCRTERDAQFLFVGDLGEGNFANFYIWCE